jgi:hypothetical protein
VAEGADPAVHDMAEERKLAKTLRRLATLAIPCGSLLLAMHGTASASQQYYYPVPELDPGTAASALVLLGGGVLMLVERLRSR